MRNRKYLKDKFLPIIGEYPEYFADNTTANSTALPDNTQMSGSGMRSIKPLRAKDKNINLNIPPLALLNTESTNTTAASTIDPIDSRTYNHVTGIAKQNTFCICKKPAYGKMICCMNINCSIGMYHLSCININDDPDEMWCCNYCTPFYHQKISTRNIQSQLLTLNVTSPAVVTLNLGTIDNWEDVGEAETRLLEKEFLSTHETADSVHQNSVYIKFKDWTQVHDEVLEARLNEDLPETINENVFIQLLKKFPPR